MMSERSVSRVPRGRELAATASSCMAIGSSNRRSLICLCLFLICPLPILGNASFFTKFLFTIFAPFTTPPPNQQSEGFPLEFLLKGPQTELRTLSQNCEQTLQKLRTNRIMNKRAFPKFVQACQKPPDKQTTQNTQNHIKRTFEEPF